MVKNIKVKMILLGDTFTGKSSIIESYQYRTFSNVCSATIGVDFVKSTIQKNDSNYNLFIWDTSGQEKFNSIILSYYRNISVVILVFDLSNRKTFENLEKWIMEIFHYSNESVIIKLVGNKCDKTAVIDKNEIKNLCEKNNLNFSDYLEVSAKKNINIDKIFENIVDDLDFKLNNFLIIPNRKNGISVINEMEIDLDRPKKKKYKCCNYL